jgi:CRP-like cAMP-binding protein
MPKVDEWQSPGNRLLATLPVKEYERLLPSLELVQVSYKQVLHETGEAIEDLYFPNDAIIVLLSSVEKGATVEVGMVGNEGMVGVSVLFGGRIAVNRAIVLTVGSVTSTKAEPFSREFRQSSALQDVLLPYTYALLMQIAQSAACHRYHSPTERLARWLLMLQDRAKTMELKVTQNFIAELLGTRRATITEAARGLQKRGLIQSRRGRIVITNRQGLEAAACNCYRIIKEQLDSIHYA